MRTATRHALSSALLTALLLCGSAVTAEPSSGNTLRTTVVTGGLEHPWSLAFLPDGSLLVSERPGRLQLLSPGARGLKRIGGLPNVVTGGQAGFFDLALDPDFARNRTLYFSYAEGDAEGRNGLAVARATLAGNNAQLAGLQVIFRQVPKVDSHGHFGGRLVFARDGSLYITLGDRQSRDERDKAQHTDKHHGKVVRILPDGRVPADNPFLKSPGTRPEIFSLGHRNPQGAALHPGTGELWISEHGPQGGDEINVVRAGRNYGWPVITWGCEYVVCTRIGEGAQKAGMEQPVTYWVPKSIAPSGLAFYTGDRYPGWQGSLFSGALAGEALWRLTLDGNRVIAREALLEELGERIRDVRQGPDGLLYLLTDSDDGKVLRIEPPAIR